MFDEIIQKMITGIFAFLLKLDAIVYNLLCSFYEIFLFLAKLNIFNTDDYNNIVQRIYIVLGVIMLFVLSYALLRAIINPDNFAKDENSFPNIIKKVLVSLVIIALLPTIFETVFRVQAVILNSNVIGKLILSDNFSTSSLANGGRVMASTVFKAFFRADENAEISPDYSSDMPAIKNGINEAFTAVEQGQSFMIFSSKFTDSYGNEHYFPSDIANNAISYTFIISTIAGGFMLWTVLLFCFDLAIRAIKLIYYQLIAPVAVICRVLPGSKPKTIFQNWLKYTANTFAEVFIRIFIMYLGIYLITLVRDRIGDVFAAASQSGLSGWQEVLIMAFLVMGIVAFIRQAPKLLQDVFGIETGGMNLGFKGLFERLGNGGAFALGGATIAGIGGLGQSLKRNIGNVKNAKGFLGKTGAIGRTIAGIPGGFIGAGGRTLFNNLNAKNVGDAKSGVNKGISGMLDSMEKKENYRASVKAPFIAGTMRGRIKSGVKSAGAFVGLGGDFERLQNQQKVYNEANALASVKDLVADDAAVMSAAKQKEEIAKKDVAKYVADLQSNNYQIISRNGQNLVAQVINGAAHIVMDSNGNTYGSLEALARDKKAEEVDKADMVFKLTQQLAIHEKMAKGDGRFTAAINKTNRLINENKGDSRMSSLGQVRDLTASELQAIRTSLSSDNENTMKATLKALEGATGTLLHTDKAMKTASGEVAEQLANLREKQTPKS